MFSSPYFSTHMQLLSVSHFFLCLFHFTSDFLYMSCPVIPYFSKFQPTLQKGLAYCSSQIYIQKWNNPAARSSKVKVIPHSFELAVYVFLETYSYEIAAKLSVILSSQLKPKSLITHLLWREKTCWIISTLR